MPVHSVLALLYHLLLRDAPGTIHRSGFTEHFEQTSCVQFLEARN